MILQVAAVSGIATGTAYSRRKTSQNERGSRPRSERASAARPEVGGARVRLHRGARRGFDSRSAESASTPRRNDFMHGVYVYVGQVRVVIEALVAANEERQT
jgi:hypothetical protein